MKFEISFFQLRRLVKTLMNAKTCVIPEVYHFVDWENFYQTGSGFDPTNKNLKT